MCVLYCGVPLPEAEQMIDTHDRQTTLAAHIPKPPYNRSSKETYNYIIRAAKNTHLKIVTHTQQDISSK
jgi:hypothetical protein